MLPDLNRLKIFSLVYLNKSVSGAARELNLSQPAVSQHLKKLEQELRIPLFTRTNKKMIPTPAAARLHERIAPFISELQEEVKYLGRPLDTPYGQLRIGSFSLFARHYLPIVCSHFRFRFPTVTFKVEQGNGESLLPKISQGCLDLAIIEQIKLTGRPKLIDTRLYSCTKIVDGELVLACSRSYYQRKIAGKPDYEVLKKLEFLSSDCHGLTVGNWFQHHFNRSPFELNCVLSCDDPQTVISGIRYGLGLGITPYHMIQKEIESGAMVMINGGKKQLCHTISLVQLKNKKTTLTEKAFIAVLTKELEKSAIGSKSIQRPTTATR